MTKVSRAELTISRSLRALAIAQSQPRRAIPGVIAIDGERSCAGVGRRDRFVTNAIARRRPPRRSLLLAGPRAAHDRKGDIAIVRWGDVPAATHDCFPQERSSGLLARHDRVRR
jgi:hypothetical protein